MKKYTININEKNTQLEAEADTPLLWVIRDYVGLKSTNFGFDMAKECVKCLLICKI